MEKRFRIGSLNVPEGCADLGAWLHLIEDNRVLELTLRYFPPNYVPWNQDDHNIEYYHNRFNFDSNLSDVCLRMIEKYPCSIDKKVLEFKSGAKGVFEIDNNRILFLNYIPKEE